MLKKTFIATILFGLLIFLVIVMTTTKKDTSSYASHYSFLSSGFNFVNYKKCVSLIDSCPFSALFREQSCVARVLQKNKICRQFKKLSDVLEALPTSLYVKKINNFAIVDHVFAADGQHAYYIIANGSIIDTNIDPRQLSRSLNKKYNKKDLLTVNWNEPSYQENDDGTKTITAILKITDTCLACDIIGWATIDFNFSTTNTFTHVELREFSTGKNPPETQ